MKKILPVMLIAVALLIVPAKFNAPVKHTPVGLALQAPVTVQDARADWYINGSWQSGIPFWFTLEEAIEAYYGLL